MTIFPIKWSEQRIAEGGSHQPVVDYTTQLYDYFISYYMDDSMERPATVLNAKHTNCESICRTKFFQEGLGKSWLVNLSPPRCPPRNRALLRAY